MKKITSIIFLFLCIAGYCQNNNVKQSNSFRILVFPFSSEGDNNKIGIFFSKELETKLAIEFKNSNIEILDPDADSYLAKIKDKEQNDINLFDKKTAIEVGNLRFANYIVIGNISNNILNNGEYYLRASLIELRRGIIATSYGKAFSINNNTNNDTVITSLVGEFKSVILHDIEKIDAEYTDFKNSIKFMIGSKNVNNSTISIIHEKMDITKEIFAIAAYEAPINEKEQKYISTYGITYVIIKEIIYFTAGGIYWIQQESDGTEYEGGISWYDCIYNEKNECFYLLTGKQINSFYDFQDEETPSISQNKQFTTKKTGYLIVNTTVFDSLKTISITNDTIETYIDDVQVCFLNYKIQTIDKKSEQNYINNLNNLDFKNKINNLEIKDGKLDIERYIKQARQVALNFKPLIERIHFGEYYGNSK